MAVTTKEVSNLLRENRIPHGPLERLESIDGGLREAAFTDNDRVFVRVSEPNPALHRRFRHELIETEYASLMLETDDEFRAPRVLKNGPLALGDHLVIPMEFGAKTHLEDSQEILAKQVGVIERLRDKGEKARHGWPLSRDYFAVLKARELDLTKYVGSEFNEIALEKLKIIRKRGVDNLQHSHGNLRRENLQVKEGKIMVTSWREQCLAPLERDLATVYREAIKTMWRNGVSPRAMKKNFSSLEKMLRQAFPDYTIDFTLVLDWLAFDENYRAAAVTQEREFSSVVKAEEGFVIEVVNVLVPNSVL